MLQVRHPRHFVVREIRASTDEKIWLSTTIYYQQLNVIDNLNGLKTSSARRVIDN